MGPAPATTSARRRTVLLIGAAAAMALLALSVFTGGPEVDQGQVDPARKDAPARPRSETPDALEASRPERLHTPASDQVSPAAPSKPTDPTLRPEQVDLFVLDPAGAPLLERGTSPLAQDVLLQLRLCLVDGEDPPASVESSLAPIPQNRRLAREAPGWVNRFDRPEGPAHCVLVLGTSVVASAPVLSEEDAVRIIVDADDVAAQLCVVRGQVAGLDGASRHVLVIPRRVAGVRAKNIGAEAGGPGESFEFRNVPPGPCRLRVHLTAHHLVSQLRRAEDDGVSLALGSRAPDRRQWELRLAALAEARHPYLDLDLDLAAGETLDLGRLAAPDAGVAVFRLRDDAGGTVKAHGVEVRLLGPGEGATAEPTTWTFEDQVAVFPLPTGEITLALGQGELGALPTIVARPGADSAMGASIDVELRRVAVVDLSRAGAKGLYTETGCELRSSRRWSGGRYRGQSIGGDVLLVPPGRFRVESDEGASWIQVEPGALVRVSVTGAAESSPLPEASEEMRR
ncbi:MAG: hypothetical protein VX015_02090 [Planctomycetota bacterium]|nr:hypothetical protein [Planctomycetota bacterium]